MRDYVSVRFDRIIKKQKFLNGKIVHVVFGFIYFKIMCISSYLKRNIPSAYFWKDIN